jgi:hypothetical protein
MSSRFQMKQRSEGKPDERPESNSDN